MFPLIPNGNVAAVLTSGVAQAEHQSADGEGSGGPQGEHAEAPPRRERQSLYIDRVLDIQAGGYRTDLLQVPMPLLVTDHASDDRENVQQAEDEPDRHRRFPHDGRDAEAEQRDQGEVENGPAGG